MTVELRSVEGAFLEATIRGDRLSTVGITSTVTKVDNLEGTAGVELGTTLVDTGNLVAGNWRFLVLMQSNVAVDIDIERRNVADDAALQTLRVSVPENTPIVVDLRIEGLLANESLLCVLRTEIVSPAEVNTSIQGLV